MTEAPVDDAGAGASRRALGVAAAVAAGWIALWWLVVLVLKPSPDFLPSPAQVVQRIALLARASLGDGTLWLHVAMSLYRFLAGFALAVAVGIPLGILMGYFRVLDRIVTPIFELLRPIPPIAWAPFAIIWFGGSLGSQAMVIFTAAFAPILINSYRAVKLVEPSLVGAARTLGASPRVVLMEVVLPASVPLLIAGVRIGLAAGWMALIAAEIVAGDGASSGLGYLILVGQRTLQANLTIGAMLVIGVLGAAIDYGVRRLERRVVTWQ